MNDLVTVVAHWLFWTCLLGTATFIWQYLIKESRDDYQIRRGAGLEEVLSGQIRLFQEYALLGRSRRSLFVLSEIGISRRHLQIEKTPDGAWRIRNSARYPFLVDGVELAPQQTITLADGAQIKLTVGSAGYRFHAHAELPVVPRPFDVQLRLRWAEGVALLLSSVTLLIGLTAVEYGMRRGMIEPVFDWGRTFGLGMTYTIGALAAWLALIAVQWLRSQRFAKQIHQDYLGYSPQFLLPIAAVLIVVGALAIHSGDEHILNLAQEVETARLAQEAALAQQANLPVPESNYPSVGNRAMVMVQWSWLFFTFFMVFSLLIAWFQPQILQFGQWLEQRLAPLPVPTQEAIPAEAALLPPPTGRLQGIRRRLGHPTSWHIMLDVAAPLGVLLFALLLLGLELVGVITRTETAGQLVRGIPYFPLQPSEFMRVLVIAGSVVSIARYLKYPQYRGPFGMPWALPAMLPALVFYYLVTSDTGTVLVALLSFGLLWATALSRAQTVALLLFAVVLIGIPLLLGWVSLPQIDQNRFRLWLERPAGQVNEYVYVNSCRLCQGDRELRQALYAIADGQQGSWFGVGPGQGVISPPAPAPNYVTAPTTDYVLIAIAEEYGLVGVGLVLLAFAVVISYGFSLAQLIRNPFWRYVAAAAATWYLVPTVIVALGVARGLPLVGLPLPFLTSGRSAALTSMLALVCLLAASQSPQRRFGTLPLERQFVMSLVGFSAPLILGAVFAWYSVFVWFANPQILQDTKIATTLGETDPRYRTLLDERRMGGRLRCKVAAVERHALRSQGGAVALMVPVAADLGCQRYQPYQEARFENAAAAGLETFLRSWIADAPQLRDALARGDIETTIEYPLQRSVAELLSSGLGDAAQQPWGQAIVMDQDGRILAIADQTQVLDQLALQQIHVPGSVMKIVTAAAALERGMSLVDEIPCNAGAVVRDRPLPVVNSVAELNCAYAGASTNLSYALAYSVNTFFVGLTDAADAAAVGNYPGSLPVTRSDYYAMAERFGLLPSSLQPPIETTVIEGGATVLQELTLPRLAPFAGETLPVIASSYGYTENGFSELERNNGRWADTAYGQGNTVTTVFQAAAMMQMIVNEGTARTPRLIDSDRNDAWDGNRLDRGIARDLQQLLRDAVNIPLSAPILVDGAQIRLAGAAAVFDGDRQLVMGKTGTAEREGGVPISWFTGAVTLDGRQYIAAVLLSRQAEATSGQCSAAAIAGTIFDHLAGTENPLSCRERGN